MEWQVLAAQQEARRPIPALDGRGPRDDRFFGVAGPPDIHARDEAQACRMLDRLMRGTVFAETDRIVTEHENRADAHQRRHAQRAATIVGESEERAAVR